MSAAAVKDLLNGLTRLRGVRAAVVTSSSDGLVVAGSARIGLEVDTVAAFGASVVRRLGDAARESELGGPRMVTIDATAGRLMAAVAGDHVVVVVTDREAHPGVIRVTAQRVAAALPALLGAA